MLEKSTLKEVVEKHGAWFTLWVVLISAALYSRPLIPIDETRYLSVAWEMWQKVEFLVPHINGAPYSHKPPLLFWLIDFVWSIFGVSESSARLVAPCFGLFSILLTYRLAQRFWPAKPLIPVMVPYLMLGTMVWSVYSSLTMFDTLLATFVLLSLHSVYSASKKRFSTASWLLAGLFMGIGILAKGPVVFAYILPVILFAPMWVGQQSISWPRWYLGALLAIVIGVTIALCWALPAASAGGEEYANAIFLHQTADRMVNSFAHKRPFYWYLTILPLLLFPWFFWLPSWQAAPQQWQETGTRFCLVAIVAPLLLLSSISGKQIHYFLPVMPFVILLIGRNLSNLQETGTVDRFPIFVILISLGIVLILLPSMPLKGGDRAMLMQLPSWLPAIPIACAIPLLLFKRSAYGGIRLVSVCMVALFAALHLSLQEPLHATYSQSGVASFLKKAESEKRPIAVFPGELFDQFHFAGKLRQPLYPAHSASELMKWVRRHPRGYSVMFTRDKNDIIRFPSKFMSSYKNGWISVSANSELTNPSLD